MKRYSLVAGILLLWGAIPASAHFVYIVPDGAAGVAVVLSENLEPDPNVGTDRFADTKLQVRDSQGQDEPITLTKAEDCFKAAVPGKGPRIVFGRSELGVLARGTGKPLLLGPVPAEARTLGKVTPVEIVPVGAVPQLRFQVLSQGKPAAGIDVSILTPSDKSEKVVTDDKGLTPVVSEAGRYAVWARIVEAKPGELGGKKYEEIRHYPTLVCDAPEFSPLPKGVSSFGAIAADGYLYVYGGHAGKTHSYDTQSVLGTFHRLKLSPGATWETLPGGPILQGMNLAAHGGKIYRVGGMTPKNAPGEPADNHSISDAAYFDTASGQWQELPPLPAPRSSHELLVAGDKLVVVGGWQLRGHDEKPVWHDTALILDLAAKTPKWQSIPQPFVRRALTGAAVGSRVYVLGGLGTEGMYPRTDILDLDTGTWSRGPDLPGGDRVGFSPAAGVLEGRVIVNTSAGPVYRLNSQGNAWDTVGEAKIRRMVHRLVPHSSNSVLLIGGANRTVGNVAEIERVSLSKND